MGVLLLVRHGQASLGTANYDQLSQLGCRQARATGARLARADLVIGRVICGTLARQRDTAAAVMAEMPGTARAEDAGPPGFQPRIDDRLDEYDHIGVLAAVTSAVGFEGAASAVPGRVLQHALDEAIARWAAAGTEGSGTEGSDSEGYGESHDSFTGRVHSVLDDLTSAPGCTLAVTSGGVIAVACARMLGLPADRWPMLARVIVNGSITKIISGQAGTNLLTFNDYAHLEGDRSLVTYR